MMDSDYQSWLQRQLASGIIGQFTGDDGVARYTYDPTGEGNQWQRQNGEGQLRAFYDQYNAPGLYGSQGLDYAANWGGQTSPMKVQRNGRDYYRIGANDATAAYGEQLEALRKQGIDPSQLNSMLINDPELGYLLPMEAVQALNVRSTQHNRDFLNDNIGPIFGALATAGVAASGGALAAGAEGAAGGAWGYPQSWNMLAGEIPQGGMTLAETAGAGAAAGETPSLWSQLYQAYNSPAGQALRLGSTGAQLLSSLGGDSGSFADSYADTNPFNPGTNPLNNFSQPSNGTYGSFDQFINPEVGHSPSIPFANGFGPDSSIFDVANGTSSGLLSKLGASVGDAAAKSAIGRLLSGTATADDYAKLIGSVGSAGLGLLGANTQANAFKDVYDKQMALGAPSRARLEASYQPGFSMQNEPGFKDAMDVSTKGILSGLSAKVGNPYENPGAVMEGQKQLMGNFALPQLNTYRSQNATSGQLGTNIAGTAALGNAQNAGNGLNSVGYGLGQLTSGDNDLGEIMKKYGGMLGGNGMTLNLGKVI